MKPFIAGNWKMHKTRREATDLARSILRGLPATAFDSTDVALFPPLTCLVDVLGEVADTEISVGAQNMHHADEGAYTGEISPPLLLDIGATRVLVGHSERRQLFGEDDVFVNAKVLAALAHDMLPVLCVGETLTEREDERTAEVVERQVRAGLEDVAAARCGAVTVAYEPVWAIGTGLTATPEQAGAVHAAIRGWLVDLWGEPGREVRILYGGSVKPANARELLAVEEINGALVGGAALDADSFVRIVGAAAG